ncbi:macro domain-like protein [Pholiota conissans]|uniref:Macro domain-like protein n=1 Tax=Pholiota conissans TaxID=109636 RepID=A0A9P5Z7U5_9AGAR|nr:macro domain-like protein [Pholiota conissans]
MEEYISEDWKIANGVNISVIQGRFGEIEPSRLQCDCIVSPANSYGIMDGGFDLELSRIFKGASGDEWTLTNHCQDLIRQKSRGYLPPGSCLIAPLPEDVSGPTRNPYNAHALAIVPTMRRPEDVSWNRDLVYDAMWALLNEVALWNERFGSAAGSIGVQRIKRVLMTGLGTGTGAVPARRCARQMILAVMHFFEGVPERPRWDSVGPRNEEIGSTYLSLTELNYVK